jgi:hypothetical protein
LTLLPSDPLDLLLGWPWTILVLALAWLVARRHIGLALALWLPALWLAVRLLEPVVGPAPPGRLETGSRYVEAAFLAFGPPLAMLLAVRRRRGA